MRNFTLPCAAILCATTSVATAQTFTTQVLEQNLSSPTGIAVSSTGDLYFTEVPTPGVMGAASQNTVRRRDAQTGVLTMIAAGEPEPVNLAFSGADLYWTCRSAGVIIRRQGGMNAVWRMGLQQPSGIAASPTGDIFITQVPTPGMSGMMGGSNSVDRIAPSGGSSPIPISSGEPEPIDVAVDAAGNNVYWTCRSAGVILRYAVATGTTSLLLNGLDQPTGLAIDAAGNLYFSEIPTPGVSGMRGGTNKVWQYDPRSREFTLISMGEPEPTDVAVTADGGTVYWTCTSAGVILRATRSGDQPSITTTSRTTTGDTVRFFLDAPGHGGQIYGLGNSTGLGPIAVGPGYLALELDTLLLATFASADMPFAIGYRGLLDANGMATAHLVIPPLPALRGVVIYTAFAVFDASGIVETSRTLRFAID